MKKTLASVIVPVYKVEKYLNDCVESIIKNSREYISELEIILVDDGSPDGCPMICDQLAEKYDQVIAAHKVNGGLSSARNFGVDKASGEYLIFVDSDDAVNEKFYDMLKFISENNYDVVECGCKYIDNDKVSFWTNKEFCSDDLTEEQKCAIFDAKILPMAVSKIVKKEVFIKNSLYFREGFIHEDEHYTPRLIFSINSIYITNNFHWYDYYVRGGSIVTSYSVKNVKHLLDNMQDLSNHLLPQVSNNELKTVLKRQITRVSMGVLLKFKYIKKEQKNEFYNLLKEYKQLFNRGYNLKQKLVVGAIKVLGVKTAAKVVNLTR